MQTEPVHKCKQMSPLCSEKKGASGTETPSLALSANRAKQVLLFMLFYVGNRTGVWDQRQIYRTQHVIGYSMYSTSGFFSPTHCANGCFQNSPYDTLIICIIHTVSQCFRRIVILSLLMKQAQLITLCEVNLCHAAPQVRENYNRWVRAQGVNIQWMQVRSNLFIHLFMCCTPS